MMNKLPRVAITQGDTNGIGYELILKTFYETEMLEVCTPIIYGTRKIAEVYSEMFQTANIFNSIKTAADAKENRLNIIEVSNDSVPVKVGTNTVESSAMASKALGKALSDYNAGLIDCLVLAPANDDEIHAVVDNLNDNSSKANNGMFPINILGNGTVMLASASGKNSASEALKNLSIEDIVERATTLRNALRRDLRLDNSRIAILTFGDKIDIAEDSKDRMILMPAIAKLRENKVMAFGPYAVNDIFRNAEFSHFDGILGMYHNQAFEPFHNIYGDSCARLVSGLPLVITSPIQGPSYEIAGRGIADITSMQMAIYMAIDAFRSRYFYDEPMKNPLPKLYHEKREDGDRARFAVKRGFNPREKSTPKETE